MKLFKCQSCEQPTYFENRFCGSCGHALGYMPTAGQLVALEPIDNDFIALIPKRPRVRYCENITHDSCNWLIPVEQEGRFCLACRHNRTIPDITVPENLLRWQKMEIAKHRLFYTLIELRLPLQNLQDDPEHGLAFDFLADDPAQKSVILTGHDAGLITINLKEADDATREKLRSAMGEPYRTLLGHFRHEVGHHFWDILVRDAGRLEQCREVFGNDEEDYGEALQRHYADGAPSDWQNNFISAYATAHPWEDFAETWAHYLHIVDTLETASAFGLRIHPVATRNKALNADLNFDPHKAATAEQLLDAWLPLTFAMNNLNRSMGYGDLYPFVISGAILRKLQFIHEIIRAGGAVAKQPAALPRKRGLLSRVMSKGAAPEQPPSQPPARPTPPPTQPPVPPSEPPAPPSPPGPDIPTQEPPSIDPPIDPPNQNPPIEVPPNGPLEIPEPLRAANG